MHYVKSRPPAVHRGGSTGAVGEVILERDEWVTRIEGSKLPNVVSHLKFVSNKGSRFYVLTKHLLGRTYSVSRDVGALWVDREHGIHYRPCQQRSVKSCLSHGVTLLPRKHVRATNYLCGSRKSDTGCLGMLITSSYYKPRSLSIRDTEGRQNY